MISILHGVRLRAHRRAPLLMTVTSVAVILGGMAAEPSAALANGSIECVNFVSDDGFTLQQADGWTIHFEDNTAPGADAGLYNLQKHKAYALNPNGERAIEGTIAYLDTLDENHIEFRLDWVDRELGTRSRTYTMRMARVGPDDSELKAWAPNGPNHYRMTDMRANDARKGDLVWFPVNDHRFRCGGQRTLNQSSPDGTYRIDKAGPDWVTD